MDQVTLRVIDGPDVGSVFDDLSLPITIGREKGNTIKLHDARISRFHVKILKDKESILLVDMGSTNGTWVNGNIIQFWPLRPGDLIAIGCTRFLFGSRLEIAARINAIRKNFSTGENFYPDSSDLVKSKKESGSKHNIQVWEQTLYSALNSELFADGDVELLKGSFPPVLPTNFSPNQIASMTQFFTYFEARFRNLLDEIKVIETNKSKPEESANSLKPKKRKSFFSRKKEKQEPQNNLPDESIILNFRQYQNILDIVSLFANYLGELTKDPTWLSPSQGKKSDDTNDLEDLKDSEGSEDSEDSAISKSHTDSAWSP